MPRLLAEVTSIKIVQLPLTFDEAGRPVWAAVVNGTVTNTTAETVLLQGLTVVAHVVDGDVAPVQVPLTSPLLVAGSTTPFGVVVALGSTRPAADTVTARAEANSNQASC